MRRAIRRQPESDHAPDTTTPAPPNSPAISPEIANDRPNPVGKERVGLAAAVWMSLTLAVIVFFGGIVIWHLQRRARLVQNRLGPPREIQWFESSRGQGQSQAQGQGQGQAPTAATNDDKNRDAPNGSPT